MKKVTANQTSALVEARNCNFPPVLEIMTDGPTNQPTNKPTDLQTDRYSFDNLLPLVLPLAITISIFLSSLFDFEGTYMCHEWLQIESLRSSHIFQIGYLKEQAILKNYRMFSKN